MSLTNLWCIAAATAAVLVVLAVESPAAALFAAVEQPPPPAGSLDDEPLHSRLVRIDLAQLRRARAAAAESSDQYGQTQDTSRRTTEQDAAPQPGTTLTFNLFDDAVVTGIVERTAPTFSGGYVLSGRIVGEPLGTLTLVVNGETVAGTVRLLDGTYRIRSVGDGLYAVSEVEEPPLNCEVEESLPDETDRDAARQLGSDATAIRDVLDFDAPSGAEMRNPPAESETVIDVAVFYTPTMRDRAGGTASMRAEIDRLIAETNGAFRASAVHISLALVATEEVAYTEVEALTDIRRFQQTQDGYMDEVHTVRERVQADVMLLLPQYGRVSQTGQEGRAYVGGGTSYAFAVAGNLKTYIFIHELGHVIGYLSHGRYDSCRSQACSGYAYGYVNQRAFEVDTPQSARWYTIMAAPDRCSANGLSCDLLLRFSNPTQVYPDPGGDPMGVLAENPSTGWDGPADAARALNERRQAVADYRHAPDITVSFEAAQYTATEGGSGVEVTVSLSEQPRRPIVIPLMAAGATARDYALSSTELHFAANVTTQSFTVTAVDDGVDEDAETLLLAFGSPLPRNVTAGSAATITLEDNDTATGSPRILAVQLTSDPGADTTYAAGDEIEVMVSFDRHVTVTGRPRLALTIGDNTRWAAYREGEDEIMRFVYAVAGDDSDDNGVSLTANRLELNGGTIRDSANRDAVLDHTAVADDGDQRVDGVAPVLEAVVVNYGVVTLTYAEALDEAAVPTPGAFTLTGGSAPLEVVGVAVVGQAVTLALGAPVVQSLPVTVSYRPAAVPLRDRAGNAAAAFANRTPQNDSPEPAYDDDRDGLIEVAELAQLDAVRHDPAGAGVPTPAGVAAYRAAFPAADAAGRLYCHQWCAGYELVKHLDFDTNGSGGADAGDAYWNGGAGWAPIGDATHPFTASFDGNGHTVANLFIWRPGAQGVGLFGVVDGGSLERVGLPAVDIRARERVGGLVGEQAGSIRVSYVTGRVEGRSSAGGLVGMSRGSVTDSYATVSVEGGYDVGGLVGTSAGAAAISDSYASGRVAGTFPEIGIGGLVGQAQTPIRASYATAHVSGSAGTVGGLVGSVDGGSVTASYWDTATSGRPTGSHGQGRPSAQLQAPTGARGLYATWSTAHWDFGTAGQYPALKVDFDGDGRESWREFGHQLRAGPQLTVTETEGGVVLNWRAVDMSPWRSAPGVTYTVYRTDGNALDLLATGVGGLTYTDHTVLPSSSATYQVAAVVNGGEAVRSALVTAGGLPPPPPPPPPQGGGGSSGSRDQHGNTAAQATRVRLGSTAPWAASTPGQINPAADVDYFTLTPPQAGVLVVETLGAADIIGTVWQDGEELARADGGGERQNFRLSVRVRAGPVVVAVEGKRRQTGAYTLEMRVLSGYLENPGSESFQSGIGVISGWVCSAEEVKVEIGDLPPQEAGYGTERRDTVEVCRATDNGFGLLFNWNLLGDGEHEVVAFVDDVELGRATVTVTTLGAEFVRDVVGTCQAEDLPSPGETVTVVWQQSMQNFVIVDGVAPAAVPVSPAAGLTGYLENPGPNSFQSGIGVISGWVCDADTVELAIGTAGRQPAAYGTERLDTAEVCGDTDNGFGLLFNWNLLGDGEHTVEAFVDGVELGRATVRVTTLGVEFLRGAEGECVVEDFPTLGQTVLLEWQQTSQNFVITDVE